MRHAILTSVSSILLVAALVFLVLGTVSAPIAPSLYLASYLTYKFGIFGYCDGTGCSQATYPPEVISSDTSVNWVLDEATRHILSGTFIVAPIAAGITFFAFVFTFFSLFVDASALKILSLISAVVAFVASALIAIMVVLIFSPHVALVGWLLVAAAVCSLVALPLLFLSIKVTEESVEEPDSSTVQELKFGDISKMDSHTIYSMSGSTQDGKLQQSGYRVNQVPSVTSFDYRGVSPNTFPSEMANAFSIEKANVFPSELTNVLPNKVINAYPNEQTNVSSNEQTNVLPSEVANAFPTERINAFPSQRANTLPNKPLNTFLSELANTYPRDQTDTLSNSLLETSPKNANDVTIPLPRPFVSSMANRTVANTSLLAQPVHNGLNIQNGPSVPVARNRQLVSQYMPGQSATAMVSGIGNAGQHAKAPYPYRDTALYIYSVRNYGVFDHHPSVEGHQPFTELQDTDVSVERNSYTLELHLSSDGESDFTSVSQRPPNQKYTMPRGRYSPPRSQYPGFSPNMQHQQSSGTPRQLLQRSQGQFATHSPIPHYNNGPGWHQPQYPPQHPPQHIPQHPPQHPPQHIRPIRPSVSDNVLNNNPDFSIGAQVRRKPRNRTGFTLPGPGPGPRPRPRPNAGPAAGFVRPALRDGPYDNV